MADAEYVQEPAAETRTAPSGECTDPGRSASPWDAVQPVGRAHTPGAYRIKPPRPPDAPPAEPPPDEPERDDDAPLSRDESRRIVARMTRRNARVAENMNASPRDRKESAIVAGIGISRDLDLTAKPPQVERDDPAVTEAMERLAFRLLARDLALKQASEPSSVRTEIETGTLNRRPRWTPPGERP